MNSVDKAIQFAALAHEGQYRKGTDIPYITHPFTVSMMLQKEGATVEQIVAGLLHDTVEDTDVTYSIVEKEFGEEIGSLVRACSESDKSASWEERKQETILKMKHVDEKAIPIIIADKLHNLSSSYKDYLVVGDRIWERFNRGKDQQQWYYESLVQAMKERGVQGSLFDEFTYMVKKMFS